MLASTKPNRPASSRSDRERPRHRGPVQDAVVVDAHHVLLLAERAGNGSGRIYTITITSTDASGNSAESTVTVTVPHNQ